MTKIQDYQALNSELEQTLAVLQQEDVDVDAAVKQYERGLELVAILETYLKTAEVRITKLKGQSGE